MVRRILVLICLILPLDQTAYATSSSAAVAPAEDIRKDLGTIGVVAGRLTPKVKFQKIELEKGAGAAAGRTAGRGLGKMWVGCMQASAVTAETVFIPFFVIIGCTYATPFVAVFGALHGGSDSDAAKANRAAKAARKPEVKALRAVIKPALAALASEKPLQARLLEGVSARTQGTVIDATETDRVRRKELASKGIDTMLEVGVPRLDVSPENAFILTAQVRLIRVTDNEELYANTYVSEIAPRSVSEWTADDGNVLRSALVTGYEELADKIVGGLFSPPPDDGPDSYQTTTSPRTTLVPETGMIW